MDQKSLRLLVKPRDCPGDELEECGEASIKIEHVYHHDQLPVDLTYTLSMAIWFGS